MSGVLGVVWAVFWGVFVLSLLVFVHEGGHYLAARAFRVRATELFLGFPSRLKLSFKSRKVGTEFGVTPVLLGGYTRICGMEGTPDELLAPALELVTRRGRVSAQEVADELGCDIGRAYDLLETLSDCASVRPCYDPEKGEKPDQKTYPSSYEGVARDANLLTEYDVGHDLDAAGSSAAGEPRETGLTPEEFLARERSHTYQGVGYLKRVAMLAAGPLVNILLAFAIITCALMARGVDYVSNTNVLGGVEEGSPAATAGLEAGDAVTAVDGVTTDTWEDIVEALGPLIEAGEDFTLTYERGGASRTVDVELPDDGSADAVGVIATVETYHPTLGEAASTTLDYVGMVAGYVAQLINPNHTMEVLDQSSSVVGIAVMTGEAASSGAFDLAVVVAAISVSLGFMNLLPIPPFDGGKILIETIQLVIRRPLPQRVVAALNLAGLAFVIFVFLFVLRNDVLRLFVG